MSLTVEVEGISVGWIGVSGCVVGDTPPALAREMAEVVARSVQRNEDEPVVARKAAVRDMLRHGRYRPTGRGKPSSEYLCNAAANGRFPSINSLVDIANLVSLESLLPVSVVDLDRAVAEAFVVRWGREGESYVFNPSGQVLDLHDLLVLARMPGDRPCATPVKDSQETKTDASTRAVLVVVYGPTSLANEVRGATERIAKWIAVYCGGTVVWGLLP